jgi:hypothetical protein
MKVLHDMVVTVIANPIFKAVVSDYIPLRIGKKRAWSQRIS